MTEDGILISLSLNHKMIFEDVFSLKEKNVAILRSNDIAIVQYIIKYHLATSKKYSVEKKQVRNSLAIKAIITRRTKRICW